MKNSLHFVHGILTTLVNTQDKFPYFGQTHFESFFSIILKEQAISRISNSVDQSLIKTSLLDGFSPTVNV